MENVRLLVQEEGRAARNLIAFHVDLSAPDSVKALNKKPPSSPRVLTEARMTKRSPVATKPLTRVRSASTGRDKKSELQARYWAFLFGNLQRAVDEIYQTCETDESVSECKEVILVLENFTRDFHNLIEWFKVKWDYESTPPPQRPTSLAWEVRKSSPGKFQIPNKTPVDLSLPAKRQLEFYTDAALSESSTDTLMIKPKIVGTETEVNRFGLCFGDVIFDNNLVLKKDTIVTEEDIQDRKTEEISDPVVLNGENIPENEAVVNDNHEVLDKQDEQIEVIAIDQASQTEPPKANLMRITKAIIPNTVVNKKPPVSTSLGKLPSKNIVSHPKNLTAVTTPRKILPISPTSTVPPRNMLNGQCIPGRNVAATAFVPGKKIIPVQNKTTSGVKLAPTTGNQVKSVNQLVKIQTDSMTDEVKCVNSNLLIDETPKQNEEVSVTTNECNNLNVNLEVESNIVSEEKRVEKTKETFDEKNKCVQSESTVPILTNNLSAIQDPQQDPTEQENSKVFCDKNIMTDFPALQPPPTLDKQNITKHPFLICNKTSIATNIVRKSNEALSMSGGVRSVLTANNLKTVPVASITKKPESEKPAYATVSKLYRSQTAIEMRSNKRIDQSNVKYPNRTAQNQIQLPQRRRNSDGRNQTANNISIGKNIEMKKEPQVQTKKVHKDEDGWETVKVRSRWRLNPLSQSSGNIKLRGLAAVSRYSLPSPATSLPALSLHSDLSDETHDKLHKDKENQEIAKNLKNINKALPKKTNNNRDCLDNTIPKRGKLREERNVQKVKTLVSDRRQVARDKEGTTKKKTCDKLQINKDDLLLKSSVNRELSEAMMDMMDTNVEEQMLNEEEIRKSMELYEEEKMLTKEIQDLESTEIEVDTETDETETDGEVTAGIEEEEDTGSRISALKVKYEQALQVAGMSWADQMETLDKLEELMAMDASSKGLTWKDRLSTLEQLEELVARHPGRALELHQKLSSPSRRRTLPDTIQRYHARQASAKRKREQLLQDKSAKMRELLNKVEEVKAAQAQLIEDRKKRLADKLKRAEENRASHLRSIQRKAHDEEEKLREIAFINELEAQNKRHDFMALCQEQQERLKGILDERQRKQEEKAAKEAAVEERRRVLEAERQDKLEKMQERRRKREERIGREQQEKEKERLELAREKARDREERLQALQAAQLANAEELQKKIQQKQEESARRHEENIENIRQRALETSALRGTADDVPPRLVPYETKKLCRVCNVLIDSEVYLLSHLRGKAHLEAVKEKNDFDDVIIDAPPDKMDSKLAQDRERQKALRKRCKKIRGRMAQRGEEYLTQQSVIVPRKLDSPNKGRLFKCLKDVDKLHTSQGVGQWPNNAITLLERSLAEINRILEKQNALDQKVFRDLNGFTTLCNILNLALDIPKNMSPYLPPKCFLTTCSVYSLACSNNGDNSRFILLSNEIALVLDLLLCRLNTLIPHDRHTLADSTLPVDPIAGALMRLFALVLTHATENVTSDVPDLGPRLQDIISYTVSVGVVDKLATYCTSVRDPIDDNQQAAQFLLSAIQLLTTLSQVRCGHGKGDATQLVSTLRVTELVGAVSMLYGMLLHQGSPHRNITSPPPALPAHTILVTKSTLNLLKAVALLDLNMFQSVLGAEGMSLQLRHIASYLLWFCCLADEKELLHQVVEVVGFFAVKHHDNQMMLQSGFMPTVLQQLCNLPFEYFSDPKLTSLLFPTLLACCHNNPDNKAILEQELSYQLLEDFRKSDSAQSNSLIQLIK